VLAERWDLGWMWNLARDGESWTEAREITPLGGVGVALGADSPFQAFPLAPSTCCSSQDLAVAKIQFKVTAGAWAPGQEPVLCYLGLGDHVGSCFQTYELGVERPPASIGSNTRALAVTTAGIWAKRDQGKLAGQGASESELHIRLIYSE
jgi:hypothetical protein